jgi:uncharacterized membrane protein YgdD (TMEM256/DUF423 family)
LKNRYFWMLVSSIILGSAVLLGAFGAHGLKRILSPELLETFKTGVSYQFIHGLAILILANLAKEIDLKIVNYLFLLGIVLFCGNCYLYSITQIKTFAMIVPIGGISFVGAWLLLGIKFSELLKDN